MRLSYNSDYMLNQADDESKLHISHNLDRYEHPIDLFEIYGSFVSGNKRNPYQITNKLVAELISYIEGEI